MPWLNQWLKGTCLSFSLNSHSSWTITSSPSMQVLCRTCQKEAGAIEDFNVINEISLALSSVIIRSHMSTWDMFCAPRSYAACTQTYFFRFRLVGQCSWFFGKLRGDCRWNFSGVSRFPVNLFFSATARLLLVVCMFVYRCFGCKVTNDPGQCN